MQHPMFDRFPPWSGQVPDGMYVTYSGSLVKSSFYIGYPNVQSYYKIGELPAKDEECFEWIDLLEAIDTASDSFTMVELGAGYGRWIVSA